MSWLSPRLVLALSLAALVAGTAAYVQHLRGALATSQQQVVQLKADINAQKKLADATLKVETEKVKALEARERELVARIDEQGAKNAEISKKAGIELRNRTRAVGGRGLLDPHAQGGCGCSGGSATEAKAADGGPGPVNAAEAGRVLSEPFERDLVALAAEADAVNVAYDSCRAQLYTLTDTSD